MPKWVWIVGSLVLGGGLITMCGMTFASGFAASARQSTETETLIRELAIEWQPETIMSRWGELGRPDKATLSSILSTASQLGALESLQEPVCNWKTQASTDQLNGTFVFCEVDGTFEAEAAKFFMTWRKESGAYNLIRFRIESPVFLTATNGGSPIGEAKPGERPDKLEPGD
ncbi:MAG: hypothetical protein AAF216_12520 [Pseudomonadota bacterium]